MHFAISASWGPTDPTRAMLPFIFAASALQVKDRVTIMLFHDAVHLASKGVAKNIIPVGPPQRFEEILNDNNAKLFLCKPCAEVRNILSFEKDFLGAKIVRLEQNYRSTPHILAAASSLIAANKSRLGKFFGQSKEITTDD